jgi:hypothetical protein
MSELKFSVRNLEEVKAMLDSLPAGARGLATRDAAMYLIGNERRGLQYYPPYRGKTQPPKRTYNYRFGWRVNDWDAKTKIVIVNDVEYASYVRTRWAGRPWNWRTIPQLISDNAQGMLKEIDQSMARWLKSKEVK